MTTVGTPRTGDIASEDVADGKYPSPRNVRVDSETWRDFGDAVGGRAKSAWMSDFIAAVVSDPVLWREFRAIAKIRGESFADALTWAAREYRNRE